MALLLSGNLENDVLVKDTLLDPTAITEVNLDAALQLTDSDNQNDLLTPELDLSEAVFGQPGNFSPMYSPRSCSSEDSGVLACSPDDDYLLTSLFGVDFSTSVLPPINKGDEFEFVESPKQTPDSDRAKNSRPSTMSNDLVDRNRKNAESARLNRQKKKRYVEDLEKSCSSLKTENVVLKTRCHEYQQKCLKLQSEVQYLKSVLLNESTLSSLIQNIPNVKGINLSSSFSRKRLRSDDTENSPKRQKQTAHSGGVCLHVAKDVVSLEFCANCSKQASS